MGKKRKFTKDNDLEYDPVPKHLVTSHIKKQEKRLIVILENAQLETVKVSFKFKILLVKFLLLSEIYLELLKMLFMLLYLLV